MYLKYYCLSRTPFGITPDPAFLYLSPSHKEALGSLLYGIEKRKGFICLTGEVGCGKTTVLKALLERSDPERVKVVYLYNPELSFEDLLRAVFEELGLEPAGDDTAAAVRRLHLHLIELYEQGKHVVLVVDEAQRAPVETLERLRILSNLETARDKLLQIVLCGQPELDGVLAAPELRQLRQRIAVRATIRLLTPAESLAYINHRLKRVAYGKSPVFEPAALKAVVRHARGNPRRINIICDNALVAAYADQKKPVPAKVVRDVVAGLEPANRRWRLLRWASAACVLGLLGVAGAVAAKSQTTQPQPTTSLAEHGSRRAAEATSAAVVQAKPEPPPPQPEISVPDVEPAESALPLPADPAADAPVSAETEFLSPAPAVDPAPPAEQLHSTPPAPPREVETQKTYTVKAGDTLTDVLIRAYGRSDSQLLRQTLENNPHLSDPNTIKIGDRIRLSDLPAQDAAGSYQ